MNKKNSNVEDSHFEDVAQLNNQEGITPKIYHPLKLDSDENLKKSQQSISESSSYHSIGSPSTLFLQENFHLKNETSSLNKCVELGGTPSRSQAPQNIKVPVHIPCFKWPPRYPLSASTPPHTMYSPTPSKLKKDPHVESIKMLISGITVHFPYDAYPVQKYMMNQVLSAVKTAKNCLLESPTGTGKTLALLCSTLSWQQHEGELLHELKLNATDSYNGSSSGSKEKSLPAKEITENVSNDKTTVTIRTVKDLSDSDSDDIFKVPKYKKKRTDVEGPPMKMNTDLKTEVNTIFNMNKSDPVETTYDSSLGSAIGSEVLRPPKIFYGTRTHKQISQVIEQLKKSTYVNKVKMTILAARDHTCVNNLVCQSSNITEQCQALIDPIMGSGCSYFTGSCKGISHQNLRLCGLPTVYDIEDLVNVGKRQKLCPYYTLRNLVVQSDIIFCPYNYLIDPIIRESMNINLAKSIVIIDEAHNIEDTCREAGSLWLKQNELEEAITECDENVASGCNMKEYAKIKEFLVTMVNWLINNGPNVTYSAENEGVTAITGKDIINWFEIDGITQDKFQELKENVNIINQKRIEFPEENQSMSGKVKHITSAIALVLNYLFKPTNVQKYQAYFFREVKLKKKQSQGVWLSNDRNRPSERVWQFNLHLMCLCPEVVFSELLNARSIILASGTLSPLETFQSELGVDFPFIVKGWHVVPRQNLFVSAVGNGPQRVDLKGVYENTNKYEYQDELGKSILESVKLIPHGVLCFFPSYYLMEKLKERWLSTGLLEEMEQVKEAFWESRRKQDMNQIMSDYTDRIQLSVENPQEEIGAILFGVFRGKIAEGIDFSDNMARAVISVGIPFMNMHIKEVNLKIKYNNENSGKNVLPGYQWYRIQAYRALNQALGRCIRHSKDWGAVILMDSRLCLDEPQKNLPKWIQQQLRPFKSWENYLGNLAAFYRTMEEIEKAPLAEPETTCDNPN